MKIVKLGLVGVLGAALGVAATFAYAVGAASLRAERTPERDAPALDLRDLGPVRTLAPLRRESL